MGASFRLAAVIKMKAMSVLRSFCLWVLMLALPLQGFAAASMRFCDTSQGTLAAAAVVTDQRQAGGHDPSAHSAHSGHQHAAQDMPAHDVPAHDTLAHKCALCAGCCHAMALPAFFKPLEFGPLAHADPAEPLVLIQAMPVRVPEKPPRA